MGVKITGSTLVWVIALVAGLMLVRNSLRNRLIAMLQDTGKYGLLSESPPISSMDFDKPLQFPITEPIFPEGTFYRPEE